MNLTRSYIITAGGACKKRSRLKRCTQLSVRYAFKGTRTELSRTHQFKENINLHSTLNTSNSVRCQIPQSPASSVTLIFKLIKSSIAQGLSVVFRVYPENHSQTLEYAHWEYLLIYGQHNVHHQEKEEIRGQQKHVINGFMLITSPIPITQQNNP